MQRRASSPHLGTNSLDTSVSFPRPIALPAALRTGPQQLPRRCGVRPQPPQATRDPGGGGGGDDPSTSGRSRLMTQLLRGPRPDLFWSYPRVRQLHHILRGKHSHLRGLERPLGTVVLPAYVWATVSSLLGEQGV
jgi:hypothetical protein